MSTDSIDRVAVKLTLTKDVDVTCYPPIKEFMDFLLAHVSGEAQGTFGEVVLGTQTPSPDDVSKIWIATNGQRNFFEQRFFINGKWQVWNFVAEGEIRMFDGRVVLPPGWTKIGTLDTVDIPVTAEGTLAANLPLQIILARWTGY